MQQALVQHEHTEQLQEENDQGIDNEPSEQLHAQSDEQQRNPKRQKIHSAASISEQTSMAVCPSGCLICDLVCFLLPKS